MTRSVLCAVDISNGEIDVPVLQKAAALADLEGAQLDVVTVLPDFGESWVSGFFEADFHDKAFEEAQATLTSLCVIGTGVREQ